MTVPENHSNRAASPRFLAHATAVPVGNILQSDSASLVQSLGLTQRWNRMLPSLYKKSGVHRRASVLLGPPGEDVSARQAFYTKASPSQPFGPTTAERMQVYEKFAGPLLQAACERAHVMTPWDHASITHLITVSCTGFCAPGIDHFLMDALQLPLHVQRTNVGFMGCHGLLNGIRTAEAIVRADPQARVLVGAVELCSLHQQYTEDSEQLVANALFADGAAAILVGIPLPSSHHAEPTWEIVSSRSLRIPETSDLMSWRIGDHGFQMTLSPRVPAVIEEQLRAPVEAWLAANGCDLQRIRHWAIHPGGPRILDAVGRCLWLDESSLQPSRHVLAEYGNMSSPTVLFILDAISKVAVPGEACVMLGFGPGLHAEAILLQRCG